MGFAYRCDKCHQLTENQIVLCPSCAPKAIEAGHPDAQQLQPKMPSFAEIYTEWSGVNTYLAPKTDRERIIAHDIYNIIALYFGH